MNPRASYQTFADPKSPWAPWVKPVLFASAKSTSILQGPAASKATGSMPFDPRCGWVIDLPGVDAIGAARIALAAGLRPIPLYNGADGPLPMIDNSQLAQALFALAEDVAQAQLPMNAPPAFLIDSRRFPGWNTPRPGVFDNRWMVFPQDFPSGKFLLAHSVQSVCVLNQANSIPEDLVHVLFGWQQDGVQILHTHNANPTPAAIRIRKPGMFANFLRRALVTARLRRSAVGGFGSPVPYPAESSGRMG
jgi:hypothetical protein